MNKKLVFSKWGFVCLAILIISSLLLFSCTESPKPPTPASPTSPAPAANQPKVGGVLKYRDWYDGISIGYPQKMGSVIANRYAGPAIEALFRVDKTGNLIPWLATGYTNDVASKSVTITLNKGIKYHDATDFNATAVKWNMDQAIAVKTGGTDKIKSIDVIDDYTVRINLTTWDNTVASNLCGYLGMMISPTAFQKNGEQWAADNPVGTGPFQMASRTRDVKTVYKKFPGYWQKGKPYLDEIDIIVIADTATTSMSYKAGEIDLGLAMQVDDVLLLEKQGDIVSRMTAGSGNWSVVPDSANPNSPFSDIRVRQAAAYAINQDLIISGVQKGFAEPTNQWIYKSHWGYNPDVVGYPYNPTKAKQLLADAGYANGFKTKLTHIASATSPDLWIAVQGFLKAVGIDAELSGAQMPLYTQIAWSGGQWNGIIQSGPFSSADVALALGARYAGGGKFFSQMLTPDDYVKAIQDAAAAPDFTAKQRYVREIMKLMTDKYCLQVPLYCAYDQALSKPYVKNHGFLSTPVTGIWTPEEVWLNK